MTREDLLQRFSIDPNICFGKPCIRGTRIWIALIIENLADGVPEREILHAYPSLTGDDIKAALAYAAEVTREHVIWAYRLLLDREPEGEPAITAKQTIRYDAGRKCFAAYLRRLRYQ